MMMKRAIRNDWLVWCLLTAFLIAAFTVALLAATHSVDCYIALRDADCERESAATIAANTNGAVFDRINVLAGHVAPVDRLMEVAATDALYVVTAVAGLSWFLRNGEDQDRRLAVYTALVATALALLAASIIQHVYVHPRPFLLRSDVVLLVPHAADPSFPSEHTTAAFALATGIALYRTRVGVILLGVASIVGFSRIYVGLHYPADVIAGALLGTSVAVSLWAFRRPLVWLDAHLVLRLIPRALT